ncbi:hypothetical protein A3F28_01600 [Candidatus Uhrbacteria bacterium RIFCSPHIGHO2_12_FULL_57_11]|uniref:Serine aminopeptidase S33 domain-containing protein n=1 Tax=Candidatus Uhrbacteria bacterium RIFCSPHIGHO2_12_FULL_57_11 TaxID=1802398 RepID=A0A1F7UL55_9BACT|nr:MAG: hypothetical protein A3F28_01600 [Candidatus Uhrbacteria bacterium RIFCSPHIGHO2_12_FULL_57_11]
MAEKINITTEDGVQIVGLWEDAGATESGAVLLLHMMPATKESYADFQSKLKAAGISSLAIDFRGHGESVRTADGRNLDYKKFSDAEQQAKIKDLEAARSWLLEKGVEPSRLAVVGASIGANLALESLASHPEIPAGVILSPGLNYRGITTMPLVRALARDQNLYLVASTDDPESAEAVEKLAEVSLAETQVKIFKTAGHGTTMLEREPGFADGLAAWLAAAVK